MQIGRALLPLPPRYLVEHIVSALYAGRWVVSEKMLAQILQGLECDGFVMRKSYPVVPPHVEYSLTPLGVEAGKRWRI